MLLDVWLDVGDAPFEEMQNMLDLTEKLATPPQNAFPNFQSAVSLCKPALFVQAHVR